MVYYLNALLDLSDQALFIIKLGKEDTGVLLLALNAGFKLLLGPLLVGNRLLGDLQFTFDLPPLLLNVGTTTLLLLKRRLQFIQSRFQLALDLVQVSHLVLQQNYESLLYIDGSCAVSSAVYFWHCPAWLCFDC